MCTHMCILTCTYIHDGMQKFYSGLDAPTSPHQTQKQRKIPVHGEFVCPLQICGLLCTFTWRAEVGASQQQQHQHQQHSLCILHVATRPHHCCAPLCSRTRASHILQTTFVSRAHFKYLAVYNITVHAFKHMHILCAQTRTIHRATRFDCRNLHSRTNVETILIYLSRI